MILVEVRCGCVIICQEMIPSATIQGNNYKNNTKSINQLRSRLIKSMTNQEHLFNETENNQTIGQTIGQKQLNNQRPRTSKQPRPMAQ